MGKHLVFIVLITVFDLLVPHLVFQGKIRKDTFTQKIVAWEWAQDHLNTQLVVINPKAYDQRKDKL